MAPEDGVVLGALRKSVVRRRRPGQAEDLLATRLDLQQAKITAHFPEGTRFIWAMDPGVSGVVSPFKRPVLGPKLLDLDSWSVLAVARFDRVSRSVRDFSDLIEWLKEHDKLLVCLDPPIDLSTPGGRAFAQMLAVFAEYERELIRERVADSWHDLKDEGKWPGGVVPFGRVPVLDASGGWRLAPDPQYAPVVFQMVRKYLAGDAYGPIADWLNAEGIPQSRDVQRIRRALLHAKESGQEPPAPAQIIKGKGWTVNGVRQVLTSPTIGGLLPDSDGGLRRDADNLVVRIDPLIPAEDYERLRLALRDRAYASRVNTSNLSSVAYCFLCSAPMHITAYDSSEGKRYRYYICDGARAGKCRSLRVPASLLEDLAEQEFLATVGEQYILEPVYIAAVDHSTELADVIEAIGHLEAGYQSGKVYKGAGGFERFATMMNNLEERRDRLAAIEPTPARVEYRKTNTTFTQKWQATDQAGRRHLMAESGFRIYYARTPVPAAEIDAQARELGITKTAAGLKLRADHIRYELKKTRNAATAARLETELEEITRLRELRKSIPRYKDYHAAPVSEQLARAAGLVASSQPVDLPSASDTEAAWENLLAAPRAILNLPRRPESQSIGLPHRRRKLRQPVPGGS